MALFWQTNIDLGCLSFLPHGATAERRFRRGIPGSSRCTEYLKTGTLAERIVM